MGNDFGSTLRRYREQAKESQRSLADKAGLHFTYISKVENGVEPPPHAETIVRIAKILAVDPDVLLIAAHKAPPDIVHRLAHDLAYVKRVRQID